VRTGAITVTLNQSDDVVVVTLADGSSRTMCGPHARLPVVAQC
jgi:hypothetical protein